MKRLIAVAAGAAAVGYVRHNADARWRVKLAVNVLRGRPVAYRLVFVNGQMHLRRHTHVAECTFLAGGSQ